MSTCGWVFRTRGGPGRAGVLVAAGLLSAGLFAVGLLASGPSAAAAGASVSPSELVSRPDLDGQLVAVEGEVIGEVMERGDHSWVNLGDGSAAVGVWVRAEPARAVVFTGGHASVGDTVRVTGVFTLDCSEHGGEPDLHAQTFEVVAQGRVADHPVSRGRTYLALALLLGGIISGVATRLKRLAA
jgi:hypothetical protein